jgi:SMC interacting uncharacterized protein involved in chromosome segregation
MYLNKTSDDRPLKDKQYQEQMRSKIFAYLSQNRFKVDINMLKNPMKLDFIKMYEFLLNGYSKTLLVNKNIEEHGILNQILKSLGYKYNHLDRPFAAVTTDVSYGNLLAGLVFLVDLLQSEENLEIPVMSQTKIAYLKAYQAHLNNRQDKKDRILSDLLFKENSEIQPKLVEFELLQTQIKENLEFLQSVENLEHLARENQHKIQQQETAIKQMETQTLIEASVEFSKKHSELESAKERFSSEQKNLAAIDAAISNHRLSHPEVTIEYVQAILDKVHLLETEYGKAQDFDRTKSQQLEQLSQLIEQKKHEISMSYEKPLIQDKRIKDFPEIHLQDVSIYKPVNSVLNVLPNIQEISRFLNDKFNKEQKKKGEIDLEISRFTSKHLELSSSIASMSSGKEEKELQKLKDFLNEVDTTISTSTKDSKQLEAECAAIQKRYNKMEEKRIVNQRMKELNVLKHRDVLASKHQELEIAMEPMKLFEMKRDQDLSEINQAVLDRNKLAKSMTDRDAYANKFKQYCNIHTFPYF